MEEIVWTGELFPPLSEEALPSPEKVRCFRIPTEILRHGRNEIHAQSVRFDRAYKRTVFDMAELALHKNNSLLETE